MAQGGRGGVVTLRCTRKPCFAWPAGEPRVIASSNKAKNRLRAMSDQHARFPKSGELPVELTSTILF